MIRFDGENRRCYETATRMWCRARCRRETATRHGRSDGCWVWRPLCETRRRQKVNVSIIEANVGLTSTRDEN